MKKILDVISEEMKEAFQRAGYDRELGKVTPSNRPDLCEYQCNGAMAGAKRYKKAPIMIAQEVAGELEGSQVFESVSAVNPGFLNLKLSSAFLADYLDGMVKNPKFGLEAPEKAKKILIDYGGPNVAKPLHVGHLRSAIIGESIKRIGRYAGHEVIGDIHLGDWGLQMGLIITELKEREPDLVYFDDSFTGDYPKEAPFTISELEEIYPAASARSKEDGAYKERAMEATYKLQNGVRGYRALWEHIIRVSVADLKKNYEKLNVEFDLWKGESDVHDLIPQMVEEMKAGGYLTDGTELHDTNFARIAEACGITGIRVEKAAEVDEALQRAFSIDGPVLVDVVVAKEELAIPPQIKLEQAKGFSLYMLRAIISGRGDEVIELAKTNWLR